jgi:DtxR family transcriptional regulator, Mn-dependent transcriptional regulator
MEFQESRVTEAMAEVLEAIWTLEESAEASVAALSHHASTEVSEALLQTLCDGGLIAMDAGERVRLLPAGRQIAERIIRRHRLAERLICDVLGSQVEESEEAACRFEHLLAEGITNSICTLLGHPRYCPHNRPIPEGACCLGPKEELRPLVLSCDNLSVGESGRVAYFAAREHSVLMKLSSLGIRPGAPVRLLQKWPSYVLRCEETEIALEAKVARNIYVWLNSQE